MPEKTLPDEFFSYYDLARERAMSHPVWNKCEMEKLFAIDQSNMSEEYQDMIRCSYDQQMVMIIHELYQICIGTKREQT